MKEILYGRAYYTCDLGCNRTDLSYNADELPYGWSAYKGQERPGPDQPFKDISGHCCPYCYVAYDKSRRRYEAGLTEKLLNTLAFQKPA